MGVDEGNLPSIVMGVERYRLYLRGKSHTLSYCCNVQVLVL